MQIGAIGPRPSKSESLRYSRFCFLEQNASQLYINYGLILSWTAAQAWERHERALETRPLDANTVDDKRCYVEFDAIEINSL